MTHNKPYTNLGVIAIGRNEGERLKRCLKSVVDLVENVIYVDSGSTDNSLSIAGELGVEIVKLDMSEPFTAARARNKGFQRLSELNPTLDYVQFVDGDCEVISTWFKQAIKFLDRNSTVGIVCGRVRELYPERSIFNLMCDIEWDTPIGESKACGGNVMTRFDAFKQEGGFRDDLIAGEESELCLRLRHAGWRVWRLDSDMVFHDANITQFGQWWKRSIRGGYAYAEGVYLHGNKQERHRVWESQRIFFWGMGLPLMIILLSLVNPWWISLVFAYPIQIIRLAMHGTRSLRENWMYAIFLVLEKFPGMLGQAKFIFHLLSGKRGVLIEYK